MVLETIKTFGNIRGRLYVLGCEPLETEEGIGLSAPVARGVEDAAALVLGLVQRLSEANFDGELDVKGRNQVGR
jgi:hypothetical protein